MDHRIILMGKSWFTFMNFLWTFHVNIIAIELLLAIRTIQVYQKL